MRQANAHQSGHALELMINCHLEWLFTLLAHVAHRGDGSVPSQVINSDPISLYGSPGKFQL
jgi:hypothetical protein